MRMKESYEGVYDIDGVRTALTLRRNSIYEVEGGFGAFEANAFEVLPNGEWDGLDNYDGGWSACVRWLGRKLNKAQRSRLYNATGMDKVHQQQSEKSSRSGAAAEQYVASYLAIHYGLTVHVSKPGTPSKDLMVYKDGCEQGCAIQVKYRENAKSVKVNASAVFDFLVCVSPGIWLPVNPSDSTYKHHRRQLECFIVPTDHVFPRESFSYCYSNYEENWEAILGFFKRPDKISEGTTAVSR